MQHRWAVTGVLLLSFVLGACATIVEGSDQTVTVITARSRTGGNRLVRPAP